MESSELPRRPRPTRYRALAPYEDDYPRDSSGAEFGDGNRARGADRPARPPWDDQPRPAVALDTGGFPRARRDTGEFRPAILEPEAADDDDRRAGRHAGHGRRGRRRQAGRRGLLAGAVTGFLAAGVALGVANLTAAFVRPQASPIIAVGGAFIDRTPPALKNFAVEKFGENDKNMLLLGMYVTIALLAMGIGVFAWRRLWIGVAGIGLFGLFGAFVAFTRPDSHATDVIPSIAGGIAGVIALRLLARAGARRAVTAPARDTRAAGTAPGRDIWAGTGPMRTTRTATGPIRTATGPMRTARTATGPMRTATGPIRTTGAATGPARDSWAAAAAAARDTRGATAPAWNTPTGTARTRNTDSYRTGWTA